MRPSSGKSLSFGCGSQVLPSWDVDLLINATRQPDFRSVRGQMDTEIRVHLIDLILSLRW
jgi:hypothetical protein